MKHLIVVAEGVEPSVLQDEMAAGHLPWLSNSVKEGFWRDLNCGPVPYEPSNLASAFTGVGPGQHGCYSYWDIRGKGEKPRVLESSDVKAKQFWDWPEFKDYKFSVVNIQLTHPPQPINGNMISYPMLATLRASYPQDLLLNLSRKGVRYAHDVTVFYTGQALDEFAQEARQAAEYQLNTALTLASDCDVMVVNLTIADRLSHFLWHELEQPGGQRPSSAQILESYKFIDQACAKLEEHVEESVMVFSEIGFGGLDQFVSLDEMLQKAGLQTLHSDGTVDLKQSLAFEAVQGSHGIILSSSMDQAGQNGKGYAQDFATVRNALMEMRFSDGTPVLCAADHFEDIYSGPWSHLAPDIIVKPADPRRPPLGDPRWANHVKRNDQSGWHRDKGFVIVKGGSATTSEDGSVVELESIAPTIARLVGVDVPKTCMTPSLVL